MALDGMDLERSDLMAWLVSWKDHDGYLTKFTTVRVVIRLVPSIANLVFSKKL